MIILSFVSPYSKMSFFQVIAMRQVVYTDKFVHNRHDLSLYARETFLISVYEKGELYPSFRSARTSSI